MAVDHRSVGERRMDPVGHSGHQRSASDTRVAERFYLCEDAHAGAVQVRRDDDADDAANANDDDDDDNDANA